MHEDEQHLTALSICHYCYGGLMALLGCFPLIYVVLGIGMVAAAPSMEVEDPGERFGMQVVGGMVGIIGVIAIAITWAMALLKLLAGDFLRRRRGYSFCFFVAALECLNMPLGTILGVFTIVVLVRPSVRQRFGVDPPGKPFV